MRRDADELAKMRKAGRVVAEMHARIREAVRPGVTTMDLDKVGREVIDRNGAPAGARHGGRGARRSGL